MANSGILRDWIEALPEDGRYSFSRAEAKAATDASDAAIKMTLYRLKKSGELVSPRQDLFVVVPREYRPAGSPPASWFVDDLMRQRRRMYYVGLLTARRCTAPGTSSQWPSKWSPMRSNVTFAWAESASSFMPACSSWGRQPNACRPKRAAWWSPRRPPPRSIWSAFQPPAVPGAMLRPCLPNLRRS